MKHTQTEYIAGKCPFCGEEIVGDLESHQYHGDETMPCPVCHKWLTVHLIAKFIVTANKEMQTYVNKPNSSSFDSK